MVGQANIKTFRVKKLDYTERIHYSSKMIFVSIFHEKCI